jgi:hypothetical protein
MNLTLRPLLPFINDFNISPLRLTGWLIFIHSLTSPSVAMTTLFIPFGYF